MPSSSSTRATIADIFLGRLTKWNDSADRALNPGVKLPEQDIIVVHRSDGSGTTYVFVDYLSKVSPEWKEKVGRATSVNWPVGLGGKGNEGVTQQVKQSDGAIGYVELIYAISNKLPYADVKNAEGEFVEAVAQERDGGRRGDDAATRYRFPGVHHQRQGAGSVSDFVLHLASDPA